LLTWILAFAIQNSLAFPQTYDLERLEKLALKQDPGVNAARARLEAARSLLKEVRVHYGPRLESQYSYFPREGNVGEGEIDTKQRLYLRLRQDIIQRTRIKPGRIKEVEAEIVLAEAELEEARRKALYELRQRYYETLEEKIQADFYLQLKSIYQNLLVLQKKRYLHKEALYSELLRTEKDLLEAKSRFLHHRNSFESKRRLLAEALGIGANEIKLEKYKLFYPLPSEDKLVEAALKNRGEIKRFEAKATQEKARASTSAYEDMTMSFYLGYRLREDRVSGFESGPEIGFTFSMPLGIKGIKDHKYKRFKAQEAAWKLESQRIRQDIKNDISRTYEKYMLENSRLLSTEKAIELKKGRDEDRTIQAGKGYQNRTS
jgi:outer membrane protein TolC